MSIANYGLSSHNDYFYDKMSLVMDKDFADWLIDRMNKYGWSQSDLANKSGVTRQVIETYVNRKRRKYDPLILLKLAKGLGEPPALSATPPEQAISLALARPDGIG